MPTKRKIFPIINTTTNHTNPPPSQPKLQTITTIIENPNTPTKNLQIGDPKLPTQTHKHIHTKKTQHQHQNQTQESLDRRLKSWNEEWVSISSIYLCVDELVSGFEEERKKEKEEKKERQS